MRCCAGVWILVVVSWDEILVVVCNGQIDCTCGKGWLMLSRCGCMYRYAYFSGSR